MIVGFMRNFNNPPINAKLTAIFCNSHGIDLIYIRPDNINMENGTVNGKVFVNNKWKKLVTQLPPFIDISPYCFKRKNRDIMKYLRNSTLLSYDRLNALSKERLQNELLKTENFSHLVIPTRRVKQFNDIEDFLAKFSTIVLKPIRGERGRGVYILKREKDLYVLGHQKKEREFTLQELEAYYNQHIKTVKPNYILQKHVSSRTLQGDPFDCRVHVQKNRKGKWVVARNFIRIGIGQKVVSNVNQGGGISDLDPFLKANFAEKWKEIKLKINELAKSLPYQIEEIRNTELMVLGFDVAIDENGELYLFEANGDPTSKPLRAESAMLRAEYYKYVLNNKVDKNAIVSINKGNDLVKENKALRRNLNLVRKEKDVLQKKYNAIENSTSWKITKPIRKFGELIIKLK